MPVISETCPEINTQELRKLTGLNSNRTLDARLQYLLPELLAAINDTALVTPSISYEIAAIDEITPRQIRLSSGEILDTPLLARRMAGASHILFGTATVGHAMAAAIRQCFEERKDLKAILLEEVANAVLFETSNRLQALAEEQAAEMGLRASGPISPGNHEGFGLEHQTTVLALAGAENIDITLTQSGQMIPIHSISVVIGLGKRVHKWTDDDNCRICRSRDKCRHYLTRHKIVT